jgi:hypothetical protein
MRACATGSTPGSGTKLSMRKIISAPSVNQMRFFKSSALPNFEKLMPDAIWSARDAMIILSLIPECRASDLARSNLPRNDMSGVSDASETPNPASPYRDAGSVRQG